MSDTIVITGRDRIERARWLAVRSALGLQIKGIGMRRGRKTPRMLANDITGQNHRTNVAAYDALNAHIVADMGPEFNRPLS